MTRGGVEPKSCNQGHCKNDANALLAMLPTVRIEISYSIYLGFVSQVCLGKLFV